MTARRATLVARAAQERVIATLAATGDTLVADRLQRCLEAMTTRRQGAGYPWTCRGAGCAWCGRSLLRRWWRGMRAWIAQDGAPVSLAVLPLPAHPDGIRGAAAGLRRALRDVRDRTARQHTSWSGVALAGMATGDGSVFVLVRHPGIERPEIASVLRRRWPALVVGDAVAAEPSWRMATGDAADLARARRGVEPLRIVIPAQRAADARTPGRTAAEERRTRFEPMPTMF